jgi:tetratricopeptide (TPR) repeat protein
VDNGHPHIRVDSPTDLVFLNDQSNLLQDITWAFPSPSLTQVPSTAAECKSDGNAKFTAQRWLSAAVAYTKGLTLQPSKELAITLRLNRSETYLKLGYLSAALTDAQWVLSDETLPRDSITFGKALLKAGKANYFDERFEEALDYFLKLENIPDGVAHAKLWTEKSKLRLVEKNEGKYDWLQLFKDSQVATSRLDVADYVGPIEATKLTSRGRGIIASRDIMPGELLVCCI